MWRVKATPFMGKEVNTSLRDTGNVIDGGAVQRKGISFGVRLCSDPGSATYALCNWSCARAPLDLSCMCKTCLCVVEVVACGQASRRAVPGTGTLEPFHQKNTSAFLHSSGLLAPIAVLVGENSLL